MYPVTPCDEDDLQNWVDRWERSKDKYRDHREAGVHCWNLYEGDPVAWATEAGAADPSSATRMDIIHNAYAAVIRADVDQNTPKNPKIIATPVSEGFEREAQPAEGDEQAEGGEQQEGGFQHIDNAHNSMVVAEVAQFCAKMSKLRSRVKQGYFSAKVTNEGFVMLTGGTRASVTSFQAWPGKWDEPTKGFKRFSFKGASHAQAQDYVPGLVWLSEERVHIDADAVEDDEINWVCQEVVLPRVVMQKEEVQELDEAGQVVMKNGKPSFVKKYKNVDKLEAGDGGDAIRGDEGDVERTAPDLEDLPPEDYCRFLEFHYRELVPMEKRELYYGCFRWVILCIGRGVEGEPVELRHEEYRCDIGMCAIQRLRLHKPNGRAKGAPIARDFTGGIALANKCLKTWYRWQMKNKPIRFYNMAAIDPAKLQEGEDEADLLDWVGMKNLSDARTMQDQIALAPTVEPPQGLIVLLNQLMGVTQQMGGKGPNQRGQVEGIRTAAEVNAVQMSSDIMQAEEREIVIEWTELLVLGEVRMFCEMLPDRAEGWHIYKSDGAILRFTKKQLIADCTLNIDQVSQAREAEPIKIKQMQEFMKMVSSFPPPLLQMMQPFIDIVAQWMGPDVNAAWEKFKAQTGGEKPGAPDAQHVLMLNGHQCKVEPTEDLEENMKAHLAMLQQANGDFEGNPGWHVVIGKAPDGTDLSPMILLAEHIVEHQDALDAQGRSMTPRGSTTAAGGKGGAGGSDRGSDTNSGRTGQGTPSSEDLEGSAGSLAHEEMPMEA